MQPLEIISEKCLECGLCQKECLFLQTYGQPKTIAESYRSGKDKEGDIAFECSLCGLCAVVCPVGLDPSRMFLEMRREAVRQGRKDFPKHAPLLKFEKRGISKRYSWYGLPRGCNTVLFPGCALPGTRPTAVIKLYEHLAQNMPNLGMVLDCCTKPSHDLGRQDYFLSVFGEMRGYLIDKGIEKVLVACPNCYKVFKEYGAPLQVQTVYEALAETNRSKGAVGLGVVTVHDPCVTRFEKTVHRTVRDLIQSRGAAIAEMDHQGIRGFCCGEGGGVGFVNPVLAEQWGIRRKSETQGKRILTYCAGCVNSLNKLTPTYHLLDFFYTPEATLQGKVKTSRPPLTYWNRLQLKRKFKKTVPSVISRERVLRDAKF